MIGMHLGSYEVVDELGEGGMATVYRAYQPNMERFVALKVVRQSVVADETARERFQREARLVARLEHPYLVPIYDFDGAHDPPYIIMRYLEGGTLKEVLSSRRLPVEEVAFLLRQVASALDYAHRQGVVHRDIKPSNIMIDREGNAFVTDFGIARMTGRDGGITGTGAVLGTPDYMAPEQGYGRSDITQQADIYALGVMLYQMLTGQLPFSGETPMATILMHIQQPVPSAFAANPELPAAIDGVLERAMAKAPEDRFDSVDDFAAAVLDVLGGAVARTPTQLRRAAQQTMGERQAERPAAERTGTDSQATPGEQNKTITALAADAAEYAEIVDEIEGPTAARQASQSLMESFAGAVSRYGGALFEQGERNLLAIWGSEVAREDDAERAIRAALAMQAVVRPHMEGILEEDELLPLKVGIHTGQALLTVSEETGDYRASGATVSLASRVADTADGLILVSHDTYRQVRGVFNIEPETTLRLRRRGGSRRQGELDIYRVTGDKARAFRLHTRGVEGVETRLIGRQAEMARLQNAYFNAIEDSETQMVTVVGAPGLGKSRLLYEFANWAELRPETYRIFRGRATPAMTHRPFALWRDILSFRFEILDSDSPEVVRQKLEEGVAELVESDGRMAHLMGYLAGFELAGSQYLAGELQDLAEPARRAAVDFFQRLAQTDYIVLQLEDLHHADDASLDLLNDLVSADASMPLLAVAMTRPELYERRPTWGSGQSFHVRLDMEPLDRRESRQLVAEILRKVDEVPLSLRDLIVEQAEGNPYYMEELVKMLVEDRVVQKIDDERWIVDSSRVERLRVPPTLVGLLQARFDSLLYPEKLTLQRAAVVGRVFHDSALRFIDAAGESQTRVDDLAGVLARLVEREFVFPRETSAFAGSDEYIFGQAMLRDQILETLLPRQATAYHRATAEWLAAQGGERAGEYDALIAEHYELAGENELAADYLDRAAAAANALGVFDQSIAALEKAVALLDDGAHRLRCTQLQVSLGGVYAVKGDYDRAQALLEPALSSARELEDPLLQANALAELGRLIGLWQGDFERGEAFLSAALPLARELDDRPALIFILRQMGNLHMLMGQFDDARTTLEESLALARALDRPGEVFSALNSLGEVDRMQGNSAAALASYRAAQQIAVERGNRNDIAMAVVNIGIVSVQSGDWESARRAAQEAAAISQEIGSQYLYAGALQVQGGAAVGLGELAEAHRYLEEALGEEQRMGNVPEILYVLTQLARLWALEGEPETALQWLGLVRAHASTRPDSLLEVEKALAAVRGDLSQAEVDAALARGASLDLDAVVAEILA